MLKHTFSITVLYSKFIAHIYILRGKVAYNDYNNMQSSFKRKCRWHFPNKNDTVVSFEKAGLLS